MSQPVVAAAAPLPPLLLSESSGRSCTCRRRWCDVSSLVISCGASAHQQQPSQEPAANGSTFQLGSHCSILFCLHSLLVCPSQFCSILAYAPPTRSLHNKQLAALLLQPIQWANWEAAQWATNSLVGDSSKANCWRNRNGNELQRERRERERERERAKRARPTNSLPSSKSSAFGRRCCCW